MDVGVGRADPNVVGGSAGIPRAIDPPPGIVAAAIRFLQHLGLAFGVFDFVITPNDDWVMLERNPAGQWLWSEDEVGVEIAAGIADLLVSSGRR